jgi:hypothetical protein
MDNKGDTVSQPTIAHAVLPQNTPIVIPLSATAVFWGAAPDLSSSNGSTAVGIPRSTVITAMNVEEGDLPPEITERQHGLFYVYRLAKVVRAVSIVQFIFVCIFIIWSPIFVVILPFLILGYLGARWYRYWFLFAYACYLLFEVFGCVISLIYVHSKTFMALRISYLVGLLIMVRIATRLAAYAKIIDEEDISFLHTHPVINSYERSLCW